MGIRAQAFVARSRDPLLSRLTKRPAEGRDWHAPCGRINGAFLKHKLIDEFSTLIFPAVDGVAGTQSIVDYTGPDGDRPGAGQSLRLTHCETLEGAMVWLRHVVERTPG
jgi:hypothetical protein